MVGQSSTQSPTRSTSASKLYKSAPPALNEKLQRYREDPEALAELQKRVRQHKAASRPGTPNLPRGASVDISGTVKPSTPATLKACEQRSPRNFIEENAAVVTPWPCTGPLSSKAIAAAQQSSTACDSSESSAELYSSSCSSEATPRPGSATDKRQQPPGQPTRQLSSSSNPFAHPHMQEQPWSPLHSPKPTATPCTSIMTTSTTKMASSISKMYSAVSRAQSSGISSVGKASSSYPSISTTTSEKPSCDNDGTTSCLEQLGAHMAAKKESAAARAAGAADRRAALAEAERKRRLELSTRSARLEAERLAALQAGAAAAARLQQQELWSGVVVAAAAIADLAAFLERRRRQGAAAAVIADAYKRCLIRRKHTEFIRLIVRVRKAIKPNLPRLLDAAHKRCAGRILLFLQRSNSSSMVMYAAHRFRHSVEVIQCFWRQVRLIRIAQEGLLASAMKHLEQQLVARNTSAAAQAALAIEMESSMQQHGQLRSSRAPRATSGPGNMGVSSSRVRNISSSSGSRQSSSQVQLATEPSAAADVRVRSGSDRSSSGSGQRHQQAAVPIVPFIRHGNTLFMPNEFFLGEPAAADEGESAAAHSSRSRPRSPDLAAATPRGPVTPRGGYMTGQLTVSPPSGPLVSPNSRHMDVSQRFVPGSSNYKQPGAVCSPNSHSSSPTPRSPGCAASSRGAGTASTGSSSCAVRPPAGGGGSTGAAAAAAAGSSVGWHPDVVDLEVEARLRDLYVPLPSGIRRQVIRSHLTGLRRALIADREAHATAMKHYQKKLELEKLKQQLLKDAGIDAAISLQAPQPPRMKVLVSKDKLKLMIVQGMDLLQQQIITARIAYDDAAGASSLAFEGSTARSNS